MTHPWSHWSWSHTRAPDLPWCLRFFQMVALPGKVSAFPFYLALEYFLFSSLSYFLFSVPISTPALLLFSISQQKGSVLVSLSQFLRNVYLPSPRLLWSAHRWQQRWYGFPRGNWLYRAEPPRRFIPTWLTRSHAWESPQRASELGPKFPWDSSLSRRQSEGRALEESWLFSSAMAFPALMPPHCFSLSFQARA